MIGLALMAAWLAAVSPAQAGAPCAAALPADFQCPAPVDMALPRPGEMLTWDPATRVVGFRNSWRLYPGTVFHHGAHVFPLPDAARKLDDVQYRLEGRDYDLSAYLRNQSVTGLLILKDGRIAYEFYDRGNRQDTLWTSRSVAKSVTSVLVGAALEDGRIKSVEDPVTAYLPELKDTAWAGVSLHQLLQHTSGVAWNEDYADPQSDFSKLTRCEATDKPYDCIFALVRGLPRKPGVRPGQVWSYNTAGAWLVGRALERATGMSLASYLERKIWQPFGMERDGVWQSLEPGRMDFGGHGFNATLRDWGRFAELVLRGGQLPDGAALLPDDWLKRSTDWTKAEGSVIASAPDGQYGYQWWFSGLEPGADSAPKTTTPPSAMFWAEGIYGQAIALDPADHIALVQWSVWPQAEKPPSLYDEQAVFFNAVVDRLRTQTPGSASK